jgi:seryl-tRNA synthetase
MLDIKLLRKDPRGVEAELRKKDPSIDLTEILARDAQIRHVKHEVEQLKARRKAFSEEIGAAKRHGKEVAELLDQVHSLEESIGSLDQQLTLLEPEQIVALSLLPNIPDPSIPFGRSAEENVTLCSWGEKPEFSFNPRNHVELNEELNLIDFKRGVKVAGRGWPAYRGWGARLEWALLNYMLDIHIKNGFTMWMLPLLAKAETMYGSAHLPKFEDQLFKIHDEDYELYLIPTAEAALNGLHQGELLRAEELPLLYCAYTPCFRREAGAPGRQERGLIRVHQFNKVEMFCFASADQSDRLFDQMVGTGQQILEGLGIHYRSRLLCTGDMSFAAKKTIDIEAWLPGQQDYREVSSISNCGDFQARRSEIRVEGKKNEKPEFAHTLNGSGLATSRVMVAILEANQRVDGSIVIPPVLREYLDGREEIKKTK